MKDSTLQNHENKKLLAARISGYAAAAGALASLASTSNAQVIWSGDQDIYIDNNNYEYLDVNQDSMADVLFNGYFTSYQHQHFTTGSSFTYPYNYWWRDRLIQSVNMRLNPMVSNGVVVTYYSDLAALPERYKVEPSLGGYSSNYWSGGNYQNLGRFTYSSVSRSFSRYYYYSSSNWGWRRTTSFNSGTYSFNGNFPYRGDRYIGLSIDDGSARYYGWIKVNMPYYGDNATIKGWAYQSAAGRGLYTGVDALPPIVSMNLDASADPTVVVDINFDEEILDTLQISDLTLINCGINALDEIVPYRHYRANLTIAEHGILTLAISANKIMDLSGNTNPERISVQYDRGNATPGHYNATPETEELGYKVYPNPVMDKLSIDLPAEGNITIMDASGRVLIARDNIRKDQIDVSMLEAGMYIVQIQSDKGIAVKKIMKQ
jgi:hypothetical protein